MLRQIRKRYYISLVFAGLVALFGAGNGSMFMSSLSMPDGGHKPVEMASHCQSACPMQVKEDNQPVQIRAEDEDPDPIQFRVAIAPTYLNSLYGLALCVLAWSFLRRRPPDLLANYSIFRI